MNGALSDIWHSVLGGSWSFLQSAWSKVPYYFDRGHQIASYNDCAQIYLQTCEDLSVLGAIQRRHPEWLDSETHHRFVQAFKDFEHLDCIAIRDLWTFCSLYLESVKQLAQENPDIYRPIAQTWDRLMVNSCTLADDYPDIDPRTFDHARAQRNQAFGNRGFRRFF